MFAQRILVLHPDGFSEAAADRLAENLSSLADMPRKARGVRASVIISFEKLGVGSIVKDERARAFLLRVHQRCAGLGYFLHGDPPIYRLREVSLALAYALAPQGKQVMGDDFVRAHMRLLDGAVAFAAAVADDPDPIEEIFIVNLMPEFMPPGARWKAMRALLPMLLMSRESDLLRKDCLREAEALWDRKVADFATPDAFVAAFQRATREAGP